MAIWIEPKVMFKDVGREFYHPDAALMPAVSVGHCYVVSVADLYFMSYRFYSIYRALSSSYDVGILILDANYHGTSNSFPIVRWFPVHYVS